MQTDHGTHIVKKLRKNQKLPPVDLASLFMFDRPRWKVPCHRTILGKGQTRRIIWREFWIENEEKIYRMIKKRIPHHQIADNIGVTRIPLEKHLRRMREKHPEKYRRRNVGDYKEVIDRMIGEGRPYWAIGKAIGYSEQKNEQKQRRLFKNEKFFVLNDWRIDNIINGDVIRYIFISPNDNYLYSLYR